MFEDDKFVGKFPQKVASDKREIREYISFNGVAFDEVTNLLWQKQDDGTARTWHDAWAYCHSLRLVNQSAWRLPTLKELFSIYDFSQFDPNINEDVFPNTKTDEWNGDYWTATRDIETDPTRKVGAWYFALSFKAKSTPGRLTPSYRAIPDSDFNAEAKAYTRCVL